MRRGDCFIEGLINDTGKLELNLWKIPSGLEKEVLARDLACVYCDIYFSLPSLTRGTKPSWEHIVNDERIVTHQNIVRCCISCNASKRAKPVSLWLASDYCKRKGISEMTVAQIVREALISPLSHIISA